MAQTRERNGDKSGNLEEQRIVIIDRTKTSFGQELGNSTILKQRCVSNTQQSFLVDSILQSRRLTGDSSQRGEAWWKICQPHKSNPIIDDVAATNVRTKSTQAQECKRNVQRTPRQAQSYNRNKIHIVPSRKTQYSHLISNHGEIARVDNKSPIIYRQTEIAKKEREVVPLWFHPFTSAGYNS